MFRFLPRVLVSLAALLIVLTGCEEAKLDPQTAQQQDLIGSVRLTTPIEGCVNASATDNLNCSGFPSFQLLVGYRVPAGTSTPATVPSSGDVVTTFRQSSSYASELQRLASAPSGEQWIAYISDEFDVPSTTSAPDTLTLAPDFNLPPGFAGTNFTYRVVTGMRSDQTVTDPARPVTCGLVSLTDSSPDNSTICMTDPTNTTDLATESSLPTNDLALSPGAPPSVHPGDTATVPFVATLAGPALSGGSFALGAASGVPGGTAAPGAATLAPAPGANTISAAVKIPASASSGDYPVTLTATSGGQSRQATGSVHVLPLPPIDVTINRTLSVKNGTASLSLTCPASNIDPCAGTVTLNTAGKVLVAKKRKARKRALKLGSAKFSVAPRSTGIIKVKIRSAGLKALGRTGKLRANATFLITNRAGQAAKTVSHVTLRQVKPRKKHKKK
jgi:hypothetical protein